jgi:hypothetical protein
VRRAVALRTILALVVLAGCASVKDVQPGPGASETFSGRGYDDVWAAAIRVASEHFKITDSDKTRGVIHAEREVQLTSLGEYVGIFITPFTPGAGSYRVEVVSRKKFATPLSGQNWETRILRDMRDLLAGRPGR